MTPKHWHVLFCDPRARLCPVIRFIEGLNTNHQVKVLRFLELLEQMGPQLPRPYADVLRDGIHELRVKLSGKEVRLLYFFCYERFIILFEALQKHTDRVPENAINATLRYREELLSRIDGKELELLADEQPATIPA